MTTSERGAAFDEACHLPKNGLLLSGNEGASHLDSTVLREVELNPRNGAFHSPPRPVQTLGLAIISLNSSQGGHLIDAVMASGEADVYVADIEPHEAGLRDLRRLTYEVSASYPHSWTPDSRSVFFESRHSGPNQLFRQAIDAHNATQVMSTPFEAAIPIITADGRWIFFEGGDAHDKLFRVSSEGGTPTQIELAHGMGSYRCPLLRGACVIRQVIGNEIVFSRLDALLGVEKPFYRTAMTPPDVPAFAVSPDGARLALLQWIGSSSVIRVVKFNDGDHPVSSAEVTTEQHVEALQWSADGQGWFIEAASPTRVSGLAHSLYYLNQNGRELLLAHSTGRIFGVPSPDGKKLALVEATQDSNIWSLQ